MPVFSSRPSSQSFFGARWSWRRLHRSWSTAASTLWNSWLAQQSRRQRSTRSSTVVQAGSTWADRISLVRQESSKRWRKRAAWADFFCSGLKTAPKHRILFKCILLKKGAAFRPGCVWRKKEWNQSISAAALPVPSALCWRRPAAPWGWGTSGASRIWPPRTAAACFCCVT